jgi:hypothetical protein
VPDDVYSEGIVKVYDRPCLPGSLVDDDVVRTLQGKNILQAELDILKRQSGVDQGDISLPGADSDSSETLVKKIRYSTGNKNREKNQEKEL